MPVPWLPTCGLDGRCDVGPKWSRRSGGKALSATLQDVRQGRDMELQRASPRLTLRVQLRAKAFEVVAVALSDPQLLGEVTELIRTAPPANIHHASTPESMEWQGRAAAILRRMSIAEGIKVNIELSKMRNAMARIAYEGHAEVMAMLHAARYELMLRTGGPQTVAVSAGSPHDYFDALRRVIEEARADLLFVDCYMGAEFISKYMGHIAVGTSVRLLTRERLSSLVPAALAFTEQYGLGIAVRSIDEIHDRYVFVDRRTGYVSGASFKDGGRVSPTALTQIVDTFAQALATYEEMWGRATVHI